MLRYIHQCLTPHKYPHLIPCWELQHAVAEMCLNPLILKLVVKTRIQFSWPTSGWRHIMIGFGSWDLLKNFEPPRASGKSGQLFLRGRFDDNRPRGLFYSNSCAFMISMIRFMLLIAWNGLTLIQTYPINDTDGVCVFLLATRSIRGGHYAETLNSS